MTKKNIIPDSYFEEQEFLLEDIDDSLIVGVLGPNPSAEQIIKFELCSVLTNLINTNALSLSFVEQMTGVNTSDISRIKNHHLERFTIDRLIKIYSSLDSKQNLALVLKNVSEKIGRMAA